MLTVALPFFSPRVHEYIQEMNRKVLSRTSISVLSFYFLLVDIA